MKDIIIKGRTVRRELIVAACCIAAGAIFDIVAIVMFDKPFVELFQTVGYVLFVAFLLYIALGLLRLIVFFVKHITNNIIK